MTQHIWERYRAVVLFCLLAAAIGAAVFHFDRAAQGLVWCADCSFDTAVTETGRLSYRSGAIIELSNRYLLRQHIISDERQLRLTGSVTEGSFDERLRGLVSGDHFDLSLVPGEPGDLCPAALSPLYPMSLRRVLFLLPAGPVFAGKVWHGSFCADRFSCRYEAGEVTAEGVAVTVDCAGTLPDGISATVFLQAFFLVDPGRFERVEGSIRAVSGSLDARWDMVERSLFDKAP